MDAFATLFAAAVGAAIALIAAYYQDQRAQVAEAKRRQHEGAARRREEGVRAAKDTLFQLHLIRSVFDAPFSSWSGPSQDSYQQYYQLALLYTVAIDDTNVAEALRRIAEAYRATHAAVEFENIQPRELSNLLIGLASAVVQSYIHEDQLPDLSPLAKVESEIQRTYEVWDELDKEHLEARRASKLNKAEAQATDPSAPVTDDPQ